MKLTKLYLSPLCVIKLGIVEESKLDNSVNQSVINAQSASNANRLEVLSKFDTQLDRIAKTLTAFENQLQNVDRQIKDLTTLANKKANNGEEPVSSEKNAISLEKGSVNLKKGGINLEKKSENNSAIILQKIADKSDAKAADTASKTASKKSVLEHFNEKISNIQNIKNFVMTTAKNLYFASIPLMMLFTATMPTQTKALLTKLENVKENITHAASSDGSYSDKIKAVSEVAKDSVLDSDDQVNSLDKNKATKTTDDKANLKKQGEQVTPKKPASEKKSGKK